MFGEGAFKKEMLYGFVGSFAKITSLWASYSTFL
jgi:hypothetical protein